MLDRICEHIHNWFVRPEEIRRGRFEIADGTMALDFLAEGQYFRVLGSGFNDGVYRYPAEGMRDEVFEGEVWPMRVPRELLALAAEIEGWQGRYGTKAEQPYQSESFGGYSYARVGGLDANGAGGSAWQNVFRSRLNLYRKLG